MMAAVANLKIGHYTRSANAARVNGLVADI
jgi:hypothetical protein